jgi:bifunctional UDP-N-acetylglucosamine pyrophosphorylase/glucosamine-1-phosphate N-acetyltransferase
MRSGLPKVLHDVAGRPLLHHVLAAADGLGTERAVVVVGHGRDRVEEMLLQRKRRLDVYHQSSTQFSNGIRRRSARVTTVVQEPPRGTGHAVRVATTTLADLSPGDTVVVMPGDAPLLTSATLAAMLAEHHGRAASATLLSAVVPDPTGYGRVVRAGDGRVRAVVEHRDADEATLALNEINAGVYAFAVGPLRESLARLTSTNAQGEEYLTDVVGLLVQDGQSVAAHVCVDPDEVAGVNDRVQLAAAGRMLRDRIVAAAMLSGTTVVDPATTWIDAEVTLEPDTTIWPNTLLRGRTHLARGCVVGPDCSLTDTVVGAGAAVRRVTADDSEIGPNAVVGPYTHLRAGTRFGVSQLVEPRRPGSAAARSARDVRRESERESGHSDGASASAQALKG